jgi:bifunctional non-homologous end joining protein LigD
MPLAKIINLNFSKVTKTSLPANISPMLATLVDKPFDEPGWLYEVKWDGYRAIAYLNNGEVNIRSRNNKSFNEKFYAVYNELLRWKINAVFDGEIIVVNEKGISDFSDLQAWRSEADGQLVYYFFDILWLDGHDLMQLPLTRRKEILRSVIPRSNTIRMSESFDTGATEFFKVAQQMHLEGMIAKKADSVYKPGFRTKDWLKIKTKSRQEMVIGGYTKNENTSRQFSALLMGAYDENGDFSFVTPVGTGFSNKAQTELLKKFKPITIAKCPFKVMPDYNKPSRFRPNPPKAEVTWVKPQFVAEVSFAEETKDGAIRHPSFEGLREDKDPKEVRRETKEHVEEFVDRTHASTSKSQIPNDKSQAPKNRSINSKTEMKEATKNIKNKAPEKSAGKKEDLTAKLLKASSKHRT